MRSDVKVIYIDEKHTKGAGRARNYGLKEAKGSWLVFADCDDYFVPGFIDILDKYKDEDLEVVYHDAHAANTQTLVSMPKLLQKHSGYFKTYDGSKRAEDIIRFRINSPWWKIVRRDFIEKYQIQFEEVPKGNDVFFTYQVGFFAKKISIEREKLYVYTFNPDGITNGKKNKNIYLSQLRNSMKSNEFFKFIGHPEWIHNRHRLWLKMIRRSGIIVFLETLFAYLSNYRDMQSTKMEYVESIKSRTL